MLSLYLLDLTNDLTRAQSITIYLAQYLCLTKIEISLYNNNKNNKKLIFKSAKLKKIHFYTLYLRRNLSSSLLFLLNYLLARKCQMKVSGFQPASYLREIIYFFLKRKEKNNFTIITQMQSLACYCYSTLVVAAFLFV